MRVHLDWMHFCGMHLTGMHFNETGWEVSQHRINTLGLLWDRFGITCGVLLVATNNVADLESLKTIVFVNMFQYVAGKLFSI